LRAAGVAPPPVSVPVVPTSETTPVTEESKFPIPEEYLTSLKTTLNQDFGIKVEPFADRPAFLFTVVVPDKYSAISVTDRSIIKADLRSKVIPYAEGVNGVREWMNLIYNSFDPAVQARITADRVY
jgi:hypothetical protein